MRLKLLLLYAVIPVSLFSQVGINTSNPQNTFHIDAGKDNASTGTPTAAQQANDVIVTSAGNVGIGTVSPSSKLEINNGTVNGAIKIVDGTQGDGKVLTSDANGLGTWKSTTITNVTGVTPNSNTPYGTTADKYMNAYIDVPQGNWFVFIGLLVNGANAANTNYASRLTLSSSTTALEENNFSFISGNRFVLTQISNGSAGAVTFGMFSSGIVRVSVSASSVRLYVWDNASRSYGNTSSTSLNANGENYIFAIKAN
ncbi:MULTISPECIES: hypothetical protein [Chryseobacterium]|uniref:C1q domain-containing protein n=1 Tax=Chryseobacterium camelliae TaxID=1265445 RepID=A0ABU0TDW2_9FLAO|nr:MULTISPECIES: hypothetical protein [Chryseobacterium]MDT3406943.1 hypothetical protein [Pseudacidovorax intermedius]MDQ1095264.1 hypothetical protein [Chryseobacterium camelliae]MDQ1099202.1 hypothetical protein [Chryseobacterium sp. SORGH_AS_1048]MDR6086552.1 hypothetical protein [Chryseobacterium sp. SORGH_AS_0909]MDR6130922.1 hypothetical protein [Chryseobacterium sp. SORGH_AS_1175]